MRHFIFAFLILLPTFSFAAECKLTTPVHIGSHDLMAGKFVLHEAKFDIEPQFHLYEGAEYDPKTDKLEVTLFNLHWMFTPLGFLGAGVTIPSKSGWIGFPADGYLGGSFAVSGETKEEGKVVTYHTKVVEEFPDFPAETKLPIWENLITVDNGYLTSLLLKDPIYVWEIKDGVKVMVFTGKHQELCLVDAK